MFMFSCKKTIANFRVNALVILLFQILVRDCIAGLLVNLSVQDFKEVEGAVYSFIDVA